jgi:hypothetical protein
MSLKDMKAGDGFGAYKVGSTEYEKVDGKLKVWAAVVAAQVFDGKADLIDHIQELRDKRAYVNAQIDQLMALKAEWDKL